MSRALALDIYFISKYAPDPDETPEKAITVMKSSKKHKLSELEKKT